jgi:hypothetical protein
MLKIARKDSIEGIRSFVRDTLPKLLRKAKDTGWKVIKVTVRKTRLLLLKARIVIELLLENGLGETKQVSASVCAGDDVDYEIAMEEERQKRELSKKSLRESIQFISWMALLLEVGVWQLAYFCLPGWLLFMIPLIALPIVAYYWSAKKSPEPVCLVSNTPELKTKIAPRPEPKVSKRTEVNSTMLPHLLMMLLLLAPLQSAQAKTLKGNHDAKLVGNLAKTSQLATPLPQIPHPSLDGPYYQTPVAPYPAPARPFEDNSQPIDRNLWPERNRETAPPKETMVNHLPYLPETLACGCGRLLGQPISVGDPMLQLAPLGLKPPTYYPSNSQGYQLTTNTPALMMIGQTPTYILQRLNAQPNSNTEDAFVLESIYKPIPVQMPTENRGVTNSLVFNL